MMNISDEKLAQYIRGELPLEEKLYVDKLIESSPEVKRRYEEWKEFFDNLALLARYTHKPTDHRWKEAIVIKADMERYKKKKLLTEIGIITGVIGSVAATAATLTYYYLVRRKS